MRAFGPALYSQEKELYRMAKGEKMEQSVMDRYNKINALSYEDWEKECVACNDCSACKMALYKDLYSSTKTSCIYDMPLERFQVEVDECEAYLY